MGKHANRSLDWARWPLADRHLWETLVEQVDDLDDSPVAEWSTTTRNGRRAAYGMFLGYLERHCPAAMVMAPAQRVSRDLVAEYARHLLTNSREMSVAINLARLAYALVAICPDEDWSWIKELANRIRRRARPLQRELVPITELYTFGIEVMDQQIAAVGSVPLSKAELFRDGLLIVLLASVVLRRGTLSRLRVGEEVVRAGSNWALQISGEKTKNGRPLDFVLSDRLSNYVDLYFSRFRPALAGAETHDGMWPAIFDRPMPAAMIHRHVTKLTKKRFGISVNPHRFRSAAATFLAAHSPENIRVAPDLLHHESFRTTEKHYIQAQSIVAGRALRRAIERSKSLLRQARLATRPVNRTRRVRKHRTPVTTFR